MKQKHESASEKKNKCIHPVLVGGNTKDNEVFYRFNYEANILSILYKRHSKCYRIHDSNTYEINGT